MAWLQPAVVARPADDPLTVAEAKQHCNVLESDFDALFLGYVSAAARRVEIYCGLRLVTQTVILRASRWRDLESLPVAPLQAVAGIDYLDTSGALQTLDAEAYEAVAAGLDAAVRPAFGRAWPSAWNVADAIRVTARVGYGGRAEIPADLRHAMLLLAGDFFKQREETITGTIVSTLPTGVAALLEPYRRFG
ncbi:MAG: hypothetical protein ACJ8DZ_06335 [Allosphingosinicella sp.]